jgi:hypothetical protein
MSGSASFVLQQLGYQSPTLLVYVLGIVLGLALYRRCPMPAIFCLARLRVDVAGGIGHFRHSGHTYRNAQFGKLVRRSI